MIKCFRLVTGEDVIADVTETENSITAKEAFRIVVQQTQQGFGLGLMPLVFANPETTIEVDKSKILYTYDPVDEVTSQYRKFTTGLVTPPSNLILG